MPLATWNCCAGPLVKKLSALRQLSADVAVIPESPKLAVESERELWFGDNPRKGLAIVAAQGFELVPLDLGCLASSLPHSHSGPPSAAISASCGLGTEQWLPVPTGTCAGCFARWARATLSSGRNRPWRWAISTRCDTPRRSRALPRLSSRNPLLSWFIDDKLSLPLYSFYQPELIQDTGLRCELAIPILHKRQTEPLMFVHGKAEMSESGINAAKP